MRGHPLECSSQSNPGNGNGPDFNHHKWNAGSRLEEAKMIRNLKSFAPHGKRAIIPGLLISILFCPVTQAQSSKDAPVYQITPVLSKITFFVKSSISLEGTFKKWDASLTFTSTDVSTGVLDVKMQAASVDTGSGFKDDKLKSKDFF